MYQPRGPPIPHTATPGHGPPGHGPPVRSLPSQKVVTLVALFGGISLASIIMSALALTLPKTPIVTPVVEEMRAGQHVRIDHSRIGLKMSSSLYKIGEKTMPDGRRVEGLVHLYYVSEESHSMAGVSPVIAHNASASDADCYLFLADGAKWKTTLDWYINTNNPHGLSSDFLAQAFGTASQQWATQVNFPLYGSVHTTTSVTPSLDSPDGKNVVAFGTVDISGVLAVTYSWGVFTGPVGGREIVEWEIVFNNAYSWGNGDTQPSRYDVQNVGTHEMGHGNGLGDLYTSHCSEQTMFGSASPGETKKRTLAPGDINGINLLYSEAAPFEQSCGVRLAPPIFNVLKGVSSVMPLLKKK